MKHKVKKNKTKFNLKLDYNENYKSILPPL